MADSDAGMIFIKGRIFRENLNGAIRRAILGCFCIAIFIQVNSQVITQGPYMILPADASGMTIIWCSDSEDPALNTLRLYEDAGYSNQIQGPFNNNYTRVIGTSFQYIHTIGNLNPGTKYYYRVTVGNTNYDGSFRTAPPSNGTSARFLAYTDTHCGTAHNTEAGFINSSYISDPEYQSLLFCSGDLVTTFADSGYNTCFFNAGSYVNTMLRNLPFECARGNHDRGLAYFSFFFPYSEVSFYSFDYGPAHFAVVDYGADLEPVIQDLTDSKKPWKFIITHHAGYGADLYHGNNAAMINAVSRLNISNVNIDAVFGGHQHCYSHSEHVEINGLKTRYIINGSAGGEIRQPDPDENVIFCASVRSFSKVEIISECVMKIHTIDGSSGEEIETITIDKPCGIESKDISGCRQLITWSTSLPSGTVVYYGTSPSYGLTATGYPGTDHSVTLTDLIPNTTYHYRVESNGERSADLTFTTPANIVSWTGNINSDWNNPGNWCGGSVPDSSINVVIPDYLILNHPRIDSATSAICGSLTIESGMELKIEEGGALEVNNDFINHGVVSIGSGLREGYGSLLVNGVYSGDGRITYNRIIRDKYISSPLNNSGIPATPAVREWNEITGTWEYPGGSVFKSGVGYAIPDTTDLMVSFTGSLVTSVSHNVTGPFEEGYPVYSRCREPEGGDGWNLLGNPFTSSLYVPAFISENYQQFDPNYMALYIFDKGQYKYTGFTVPFFIRDSSTGNLLDVCKGFFVRADHNNAVFSFNRNMLNHNFSNVMRESVKGEENYWPGLWLKIMCGRNADSTLIVFNEKMTTGLDPGYDVGLRSLGSDLEVFTKLVDNNGHTFVRQALPVSDYDKNIVPIGISCRNGGRITFSAMVSPPENYRFYLFDARTNKFTDIGMEQYSVDIPAGTNGAGRFYVYTSTGTPTSVEPLKEDNSLTQIHIWAAGNIINIEGDFSNRAKAEIYNTLGVKIAESQLPATGFNTIYVKSAAKQLYIIRISDGQDIFIRKIIL